MSFKTEKGFLNSTKDILVCGVYMPPCNSKYFDIELFDQLEQDVVHLSSTGSVILMGDFNSRTGKHSDILSHKREMTLLIMTSQNQLLSRFTEETVSILY